MVLTSRKTQLFSGTHDVSRILMKLKGLHREVKEFGESVMQKGQLLLGVFIFNSDSANVFLIWHFVLELHPCHHSFDSTITISDSLSK